MQQITFEKLFLDFGYKWQDMEINKEIDVSDKDYEILSFDNILNESVWKKIKTIIRKDSSYPYYIYDFNINNLECTVAPDHLFYCCIDECKPVWLEAYELYDIQNKNSISLFSNLDKKFKKVIIMRNIEQEIPVLDIEVEDTNSYFSGDYLSHNTMFGDPMTTPGGKAVPYAASVRIRLNRSVEIKDESKETFAIHTKAKIIKNRLGPPLRSCEFDIHFASGIDDSSSIRDYLHSVGEIVKAGGWMKIVNAETKDGIIEELKFRSDDFKELYKDVVFEAFCNKLIDKHIIIDYNTYKPDFDDESLEDAEFVIEKVME